jgi:CTP:molybdopterin cytidylyltransferase MocA
VIDAACSVPELERIVVVLGGDADLLYEAIEFRRSEPIVCPTWDKGMACSLRCGVAALKPAERVLVLLGDSPTVTPELLQRFVPAPPGARAVYHDRPGHPVVLGHEQLARLEEIQGDTGARILLGDGPTVECGDIASGADVDTVDDLDRIRQTPPPQG